VEKSQKGSPLTDQVFGTEGSEGIRAPGLGAGNTHSVRLTTLKE
jgi:hypothetical protein